MLQFGDTSIDQLYLSIHVKEGAAGISKGFFSASRYAGKDALEKLQLDARKHGEIEARHLFKKAGNFELIHGDKDKFAELISGISTVGT